MSSEREMAVGGFIAALVLNAFVFAKYDAYGEAPIPGSANLHLPAGETPVSFHTQVIGSPTGGGLPVPDLSLQINPPPGVPDPVVTQSSGITNTVNNDSHVRVWLVRVAVDGTYQINTDGEVGGFIRPRLAFGHESPYGWLPWMFVGRFVIGLVGLIAAVISTIRRQKLPVAAPDSVSTYTASVADPPAAEAQQPVPRTAPGEEAIKLEQLKTFAALRDSGALTEQEFNAEKRRILDGR